MNCKICGEYSCELIKDVHSLGWYDIEKDSEGFYHHHDMNYRFMKWKCSKGHEFQHPAYNECWCGWSSHYPDLEVLNKKMTS